MCTSIADFFSATIAAWKNEEFSLTEEVFREINWNQLSNKLFSKPTK